ncbi:DUF3054 domain-containing protein [Calidifontibacter terrae]
MRRWALLALDVLLVLVFAAIGRASHHESNPLIDAVITAWPFLVGVAVGWIIAYVNWGRVVPVTVRAGVTVWVATVCLGMVLRHLSGRGTAFSFIIVATIVLGVFLIGWRAGMALLARRGRLTSEQ